MPLNWDEKLFLLIHRDGSLPWLDFFFVFWTDLQKTFLFYVLLLSVAAFLWWRGRRRNLVFFPLSFLILALSDELAGRWLKSFFFRERPLRSRIGSEVLLKISDVGSSGFPSSHAADAFCVAVFLGCYFPSLRGALLVAAGLTAYSRVYCGVHFPSDVMAGAAVGSLLGWLFARALRPWLLPFLKRPVAL
jgi:undecaprenyl-diphosphatase